jgi:hypothetical protein
MHWRKVNLKHYKPYDPYFEHGITPASEFTSTQEDVDALPDGEVIRELI